MHLNYGRNSSADFDHIEGVGPFRLGTGGVHISGSRTIERTGQNTYIDFTVPAGTADLRAALWWPEPVDRHSDIDLRLEHPPGTPVISSQYVDSVFEHVIVASPQAGAWRAQIRGVDIDTSALRVEATTVYYAVRLGPAIGDH